MRHAIFFIVFVLFSAGMFSTSSDIAFADMTNQPVQEQELFDSGTLDPGWFEPGTIFRQTGAIDYLWVMPGFNLKGKTLHFEEWPIEAFLGQYAQQRDANDIKLGHQQSANIRYYLMMGLKKYFDTSTSEGDILVSGRVVDCCAGVSWMREYAVGGGLGETVFDIKFTDKSSGELLLALHHRAMHCREHSNTNLKFQKLIEDITTMIRKKKLEKKYVKGSPVKG